MKLWTQISHNYFQLILIIGFLFGFSLPISTKMGNVMLILFMACTLFLFYKKRLYFNRDSVAALRYSSVVLIISCLLSILYHGDFFTVLNVIGKRISYLLIPLSLLFFVRDQLSLLKRYSFLGIIYGSILASIVLLAINFMSYYATRPLFKMDDEILNFYYTGFNFTEFFDIHPSYFGMYLLLSSLVLFFGKHLVPKSLKIFTLLLFFVTILFLGSRLIFLFYLLIVLIYLIRSFSKSYRNSKIRILVPIVLLLIGGVSIYLLIRTTFLFTSLTEGTLWELSYNVNDKIHSKTIGDSRVARWDVAMELIKEHPITGYGIGNEKNVLETAFRKAGMDISARYKYDAHNLFLGYSLEAGILGFLILIYYLFYSLIFFFKQNQILYFLFFLSVFSMCLIENYMNNNAAITFLAFFGNLFFMETWLQKVRKQDGIS